MTKVTSTGEVISTSGAAARQLTGADQVGTGLAGTITGQVLALTGDGHGHHIPGTPMVYRHGWKPVGPAAAAPRRRSMPAPDDRPATQHQVARAMTESKIYSSSESAKALDEIRSLKAELEHQKKTESRGRLALRLGFIAAGVIFAGLTAGLGLPVIAAFAVAAVPEVAREVTEYHVIEKGKGAALIAHPFAAVKARTAAVQMAGGPADAVRDQAVSVLGQALVTGGMQSGPAWVLAQHLVDGWMEQNAGRVARAFPGQAAGEETIGLTAQAALPVAAVPVTAAPVPDDPAAVSMFTAHRLDDTLRDLAHATERMTAARDAKDPDLRAYHSGHIAWHLQQALGNGHRLTGNIRAHYPAEAAELEAVKESVGLAKAVSDDAKAATTAHLLETTLHEETHGSRHALAMLEPGSDAEWAFNADHCAKHLGGAAEHAGKLRQHFADNYPAEARWLAGLGQDASGGEDGKPQHAGYAKGTVTAQMANAETITGQAAG